MKLQEGFKEERVAMRPLEGFKKQKKMHALTVLKEEEKFIETPRGFKEERVAVRHLEGFKKQKKMHTIPIIIEGVRSKETT